MNPLAPALATAYLEQKPKFPWSSGAANSPGGWLVLADDEEAIYLLTGPAKVVMTMSI